MRKTPIDAPRQRRAVIAGLGRAARLTLQALERRADVRVVAAVDPIGAGAATTISPDVRVVTTSGELPAFDIAVVSTPTATHPAVSAELLERCSGGELLLCEKPFSVDPRELAELGEKAVRAGVELRVLLHYGFAEEVLWARGTILEGAAVEAITCSFLDPYAGEVEERSAVLSSSWVDSGINALTTIARLVTVEDARPEDGHTDVEARVHVTFTSAGRRGRGTIRTSWGEEARKETCLALADGRSVRLDHRAGTAAVDGRVVFRGAAPAADSRYRLMLDAHLDDTDLVHSTRETIQLHRLLAAGAGVG